MLSTFLSDIRLALRAMRRQPTFTAVVVGTLALGIGANTAMFAVVNDAVLEPLPYKEPDRLVLAASTSSGRIGLNVSAPDYYDYEQQASGFESLAAVQGAAFQSTVAVAGAPEHVPTLQVSYHLFQTLGVKPVAGRWFTRDEDSVAGPDVVMISEGLANRAFGGAAHSVGRKLAVTGMGGHASTSSTVVGVMPASYEFMGKADLWVPTRRGKDDGPGTRAFHGLVLVGRLKAGLSIETVQRQVDVISTRLQKEYPKSNGNKGLVLQPLQNALRGSQTQMLLVLAGAVGLVLLIACANVAGLLVARGVARRSELAVRAALGASRRRIAVQLMAESLVLGTLAGVCGLALAFWLQRLLPLATGLGSPGADTTNGFEPRVLLFALALSVLTGVLSGTAPAIRASSLRLAASLAPGNRTTESRGGARLRTLLVVGQVALSLVLLVGAGLLIRSFSRIATINLGFNSEGLVVAALDQPYRTDAQRVQFQAGLTQELQAIPGVTNWALTSQVPIMQPGGNPPAWPAGHPPGDASDQRLVFRRIVTGGYFKAVGIPLVAGRDFAESDRQGTPVVTVIDELTARDFFPGKDPIGQRLMIVAMRQGDTLNTPTEAEVVGVVASARINAVGQAPQRTAYFSSLQFPMGRVNLVLRSSLAPAAVTQIIRKLVAVKHPDMAVEQAVRMNDVIGRTLQTRRVMAITLGCFSAVALLLAALGLYGVLAFYVTERHHEIGVRMALGAGTGVLLKQVLWRSAMMVGPGLAIGILVSRACSRLMRQFLYQIQPTDTATYVAVSVTLALVAFVASVMPALRASRLDPVRALRGE